MINFSVHYPYEFDIVNSGELEEGDVTFTLDSGDYIFNVKPIRRGTELLPVGSKLSFAFKTGENPGGHHYLASRPSTEGLMPREFFKPFEFAFSYDEVIPTFISYRKLMGGSEKDVIEYQKINIFNEPTASPNPRVFSWMGNLYLIGTGIASSFESTVPCVNLYRWDNQREGFEKIHTFLADSTSYLHDSCDYVIHSGELFIVFFSGINQITCYKAKDDLASSWERASTFEIPSAPEMWVQSGFRYRIRAASDSFAVVIAVMFAWERAYESKTYQEADFVQIVSLDNCLTFSSGNDTSAFLINTSVLGTVVQKKNNNILGLFTVARFTNQDEAIAPFNVKFEMYYDKKIGSFVIMKSGEGDSNTLDGETNYRLPNKCYLVGIKNVNGNYFMWESCLKLPLDYSLTVPDVFSYYNPWSSVFEERIVDINDTFYDPARKTNIPAHARAMVLEDVCVVEGDSVNDLIVTGFNLRNAYGGTIGPGSILSQIDFDYPYVDTKVVYVGGEVIEDQAGQYAINERAYGVLSTEFCFMPHDVVIPGSYDGKIYSYGGKFHDEIAFVCGPLMFETSSIFPKGFRAYGSLNGNRWYNPMGCRWRGNLIASASYISKNNYTFFSVLGPVSNVGEKYGYQHNYCPYTSMFYFGWKEFVIGEGAETVFSVPDTIREPSRGCQIFKISSSEDAAYCYLADRIVMGDGIDISVENGIVDSPTRYWTAIGRAYNGYFKVRLKFSVNVDPSGDENFPNVCLCKAVVNNRRYSLHLVAAGGGSGKKLALKYDTSATASATLSVDLDDLMIGDIDEYTEVMFGKGLDRQDSASFFMWARKKGGQWVLSQISTGINNLIAHPDVDPVEWSAEDWEEVPLEEAQGPDEMRPTKLRNGLWVGVLSASEISSLSEGLEMEMRVRQVAVSSYGHRYRPTYSNSFRRLKIDGEGPSAINPQYFFEPIQSYSPYIELPDGSELLIDPVAVNGSGPLFRTSSYELVSSRARNSSANVINNISDSIYDFTILYESSPDFEIIFRSKDGLPVDCLSLVNMVGFFAFDVSSGDYNEQDGEWTENETERYFVPYTRHKVEEVDGRTVLLQEDEDYDYQRDQLVGHSLVVYNFDNGSIKDHRIIISNFDRVLVLDRPVEISDREGVRILKRNGSFDIPENIGATGKNYFSISFLSTSDASLRAIGEVVFGKWVDLSDFHLTVSRERVKGFDSTSSSMGLLFPSSVEVNAGVKDSINVSFPQLVKDTGDADYCLNLFSDIYSLEKNFPILMDYDGKPSTEYVSFSGNISFSPSDYDYTLGLNLISQSPRSIPKPNTITLNEMYRVEIQAFLGSNVIGFQTTTGSISLRAVPINFDETNVVYVWDDGAGNTLAGPEITVSYDQKGQYNVGLRVYISGKQVAARNQTVYYVQPLTSYYQVSYSTIVILSAQSHRLTIRAKGLDDSNVIDSTTMIYLEGKNEAGETIVAASGVPTEGLLLLVVPILSDTAIYEVRDLNGATGSVNVVPLEPVFP